MQQLSLKNSDEISNEWIAYVENEANKISKFDDLDIDSLADGQIFNPNMQSFLDDFTGFADLLTEDDIAPLSLSFVESRAEAFRKWGPKFWKLKRAVRRVICKIINELDSEGAINWKDIIKVILIALIPALGGGPLSIVVLPLVISLVAKLMKRGFEIVCPVG